MENKSGRRISLNFFDILIIIIVIALTAGLIYVKTRGGSEGQASDAAMVTYEIEIGNLTEDTQNLIHAGDSVIDKVKKQEMGEVVSCEFYPMRKRIGESADRRYSVSGSAGALRGEDYSESGVQRYGIFPGYRRRL